MLVNKKIDKDDPAVKPTPCPVCRYTHVPRVLLPHSMVEKCNWYRMPCNDNWVCMDDMQHMVAKSPTYVNLDDQMNGDEILCEFCGEMHPMSKILSKRVLGRDIPPLRD